LSLLARLAPHLPYVRRYARALTGDQTTGDHYVRVALEALAAGEKVLEANLTPRVALYHVFHAIWCQTGAQLEGPADAAGDEDANARLMRIAPRSRQAFLLTALEGFTPSETAQILGASFDEVGEKRPQLVLSDIQLADGSSGIDAVNDILGSFDVPVIFITAFPERLLTGERPEPAFLITKPFSPEMVKALIAQALFFDLRSKKAA